MRRNPSPDPVTFGPTVALNGWACWGHETAVATLQRAAVHGPRHAYIIGGPEHVGKTTLALAFALALLCPDRSASGEACGACPTCRRILRWTHPDVSRFDLDRQEAEGKGTTKHAAFTIQSVRDVGASLTLRPLEGRWRVVVIDDVETMQPAAQEAFLKTLEEPPPYAVIVLLVTDPDLLLSTVRSRCQILPLQRVAVPLIGDCLRAAGVESSLANDLASLSEGLPGWGFRAANAPELREARAALQRDAFRWLGSGHYERLVLAIQAADPFGRNRTETLETLDILLGMWRSIMLRRVGAQSDEPSRAIPAIGRFASADCDIDEVVAAVKSVQTCRADLLSNVRPRLAFESMVLDWPTLGSTE